MTHKYAKLIADWALGATIEVLRDGGWHQLDGPGGENQPAWIESMQYRVKPQNLVFYAALVTNGDDMWLEMPCESRAEALGEADDAVQKVIRIELDKDTFEVVSAEATKP